MIELRCTLNVSFLLAKLVHTLSVLYAMSFLPFLRVTSLTIRSWGRPAKSVALVTRASFMAFVPLMTTAGLEPRNKQ